MSAKRLNPIRAAGEAAALAGGALWAIATFCIPALKGSHARAAEADLKVDEPDLVRRIAPYPVED